MPDLRGAGARREEIQRVTVGRPPGTGVIRSVLREATRLHVLCPQVQQPQVGPTLVGIHVGLTQDVGNVVPIG